MKDDLAYKEREIESLQKRVMELERELAEARAVISAFPSHGSEIVTAGEDGRAAEEDLRAARDEAMWLARLPGENPNPVARISTEGTILYCNPEAAKLPGWRLAVHEPLPLPFRRLIEQAITEGRVLEQDVLLGDRTYAVSVVPISGEPYVNMYGRDVTEHRKANEALIESERRHREISRLLELDQARLAAVLRHLPVGAWIVDQQGRLTGSNPEADRIWAGETPLLNSLEEFQRYVTWHPDSGELLKPEEYPLAVALRTRETVEPRELGIRRFDGSQGTVLASAAPIKDRQGQVTGAVWVSVDITDRKHAEEALRKSEERFAKAFHASPDAIVISRMSDGLIMEVNEGWSKLFGHEPEEVIGRTAFELNVYMYPEDRKELIGSLHERGYLKEFELQMRRKFGEVRQVSMSAERIEINGVTCVLSILRDITERKQSEQALRESEQRLNRAQEIAHLGSWELDLLTDKLIWSDEVYRIFGLQPQEFGATYGAFLEAVHPDDRAAVDDAYSSSIRDGRDRYEIEHRVVKRSSGEVRVVHEKCEHFRDPGGRIIRSIGMVHDITEQKQAEQALQESERRFHSLADSMPQLVWTALPDGTVDYYNQRYQEYQEIKSVEGTVWEWAPVLHPDDLEATVNAWRRSVETGETYQIEHRVRMADGSYRWHLSRGVPILDETRRVMRWFGTATDIHDLKLAEEQSKVYAERLEHSNRELEQFAFMASHDMQEPLRKIEMFGNLLQERAAGLNDTDRSYVARMRDAASRMREMVEGLLQLSRITTQGQAFAPVDLSQAVSQALLDLEIQIQRSGARVEIGALPVVEGDPLQLRQVLQNLLGNALKYHQPDTPPEVKVFSRADSEKVQIFVEDKGIGFDPQDAERIFQPFQRLVGRSQYEGNGIGLAICRRIVERHAGEIAAYSQPGQGSTFIVTLPIHQGRAIEEVGKDVSHANSGAPAGR
jgi:PAS domain S-box-containing protein